MQRWQGILESQPQSGLNAKQFCNANNIPTYSFYFWRIRLAPKEASQPTSPITSGLVPVRVVPTSFNNTICIRFACGESIEAPCETIRQAIEQILQSEAVHRTC
jgi:hypothetical protein